jgi:hypothetical protein
VRNTEVNTDDSDLREAHGDRREAAELRHDALRRLVLGQVAAVERRE